MDDNGRKNSMKKSINIYDLIHDKYFQTLFGSYLLYNQVCSPLQVSSYVLRSVSKFPNECEEIRSFLDFMKDSSNIGFIKGNNTFDVNLAARQINSIYNKKNSK